MKIALTPRSEQLLREELVRGRFRTPEEVVEYALKVLEETERPCQPQRASLEEFRAFLDALAEGSESIPPVPSSAFSRENIYRSHP